MNRLLSILLLNLSSFVYLTVNGQVLPVDTSIELTVTPVKMMCSYDLLQYNHRRDPLYRTRENEMNEAISNAYRSLTDEIITLPVVVHIINLTPDIITDQFVINGINDLNAAYSKTGIYSIGSGVDTKIKFCLAKKGPDGGNTSGITRTQSYFGDNLNMQIEDGRLKDLVIWNPLKYINIWLVSNIRGESYTQFSCGIWQRIGISGYATMPPGGTATDGIVITAFGKGLVHEMGHYLGLYHTFEGGCRNMNCLTDGDKVCDTPPDKSISPSPYCNMPPNTCNTDTLSSYSNGSFHFDNPDLTDNFMDYGNPTCINSFTQGQVNRMRAAIASLRYGLLTDECTPGCNENIVASFMSNIAHPLPGNTVVFTNTSSGTGSFTWLINNVAVSNTANLSYTFPTAAKYIITLKAYNVTGCFASSTQNVIVDCGVKARFYSDKVTIASMTYVYIDSITFTNTSVNAQSFVWLLSNDHGMTEQAISSNNNFVYTFPSPGDYYIRLVARAGSCIDTTGLYTVTVVDPTADGSPFNISAQCYNQNKIKLRFCLGNRGYAFLPKHTPITFYDRNPALPGAARLYPDFYLPNDMMGKCYNCYNHILNVAYHNIDKVYAVFNDAGTGVPVVLPNTAFPELLYNNNTANSVSNHTAVNQTICAGQSFLGYTTSGIYIDTIPSVRTGCDSIRALTLTVLPRIGTL